MIMQIEISMAFGMPGIVEGFFGIHSIKTITVFNLLLPKFFKVFDLPDGLMTECIN